VLAIARFRSDYSPGVRGILTLYQAGSHVHEFFMETHQVPRLERFNR
jgi:hypothetical protein